VEGDSREGGQGGIAGDDAEGMRVYVMSARTLKRLIRSGSSNCTRCGLQFKVGDRVTSRIGTAHTTRYHERCLEETRI